MSEYYTMAKDALGMFLYLGIELSLLFLIISTLVSLLQQYIPEHKIQTLLSGKKGWGYLIAVALGVTTPFCSCSTIPMLRGLLKAKAGFGPTLTFLFVSPLLNPIIVGLFLVTFGLKVTIIYSAIALSVSIVGSFVLSLMKFERYIIPIKNVETSSCCCAKAVETSCCSGVVVEAKNGFREKFKAARAESRAIFRQVFPYLLLGVSLGAMVYGFVPSDFIANNAGGDSLWSVPIAAVIGIPLYVRVEVLIPLSAVLVGKGMGLGAIMALIIGGSGASITELILLKSMFRMPMMAAFLTVVLGMAVLAGYLFQFLG